MQRYEVRFLPEDRKVTVAGGTNLLEAAREAGLTVEAPCDGKGSCGKCRVRASGALSAPDPLEAARLGEASGKNIRLACRARVHGSVEVEILSAAGNTFVVLAEGQSGGWTFDPPVRRVAMVTGTAEHGYGAPAMAGGAEPFFFDHFPVLLRKLAEEYSKEPTGLEAIVKNDKLLDWRKTGQRCCGVALDIGTTSVVAELFDLADGKSLGIRSCINPQTEFGGDVLTRIAFTLQHADGTKLLQQKIAGCINELLEQLTGAAKLARDNIYELVVAGNTTMQHLLLGIPPRSLAQSPYRPVFTRQLEVGPAEAGLNIAPRGVVTVLPSASAFVGADIVAGLIALELQRCPKTVLFIDIGTNGEIVVGRDGVLAGTSSAAGPALEGMNITCGCRAEQGAAEGVEIRGDGSVDVAVIGGGTAGGICGSGLIDLVAELIRCGVLAASGRFVKPEKLTPALACRLMSVNGKPAFRVSDDGAVYLSQKDVRQVQLAKGAIAAAIGLLLKELNIGYADIEEILVAGAFGFHLKPASLVGIGLLPPGCEAKIRFVGNTAKEGAKAALLNRQAGREMVELANNLQIRELSLLPEFQEYYVKALVFPATES